MPHIPDDMIPVVDGVLDDAIWMNFPMEYAIVHPGGDYELNSLRVGQVPADASDFSATILVGWNEGTNLVYIAIDAYDDWYHCDTPSAWWSDDMWEIYMDAKLWNGKYQYSADLPNDEWGSHAQQFELYRGEHWWGPTEWDVYLENPKENQVPCQEPFFLYKFPTPPETGSADATLIGEMYFCMWEYIHHNDNSQSIVWDLEAGQTVGLGISRYEDDEGGDQLKAEWNTWGAGDCQDSANFSEYYLLGPEDVVITAVEPFSWGAIKATFSN
jgi:hypothetical protein